ncbi:MAG: 30S ribosomal protein S8 [Desulfohalobiaceae bacterium]|nr:30S ribosomal protein S8 [Desulfohalobiaceae bacterium]
MGVTDPISDMLTRIRNAKIALHKEIYAPKSKMKLAVLDILKEQGYIEDFEERDNDVRVQLKYIQGRSAVTGLKRLSKPSCRKYVGYDGIPRVQNGLGISILSTSKGIMDGQKAKELKTGGELLCQIW